ncbi:MAG: hypothetical protein ACE5LC_00445 [Candidatus Aminicenantales bacterium]
MNYYLFTYPNCEKCQALKDCLSELGIEAEELNLVFKKSKMKIREFLPFLRRDEKGGIIIPTLIVEEEGRVEAVVNKPPELEDWLKSRD